MTNPSSSYLASELSSGDGAELRNLSFTKWLSAEWLQPTTEFGRKVGLYAIYAETSDDKEFRYLYWQTPKGAFIEIRSGRVKAQFEEFDKKNRERQFPLLSLHISTGGLYSAVWVSPDIYELAKRVMAAYGISPAQRPAA